MKTVQAAISSISFPDDPAHLEADIADYGAERALDLDVIMAPDPYEPGAPLTWSAPKYLVQGDILFFYHTRSALKYIRRTLRLSNRSNHDMRMVLVRARNYFDRFGGTIFGCAEIAQPAEFENVGRHFEYRSQAPIRRIHTFEHPVHLSAFAQFIPPPHGNTVTPLTAPQFNWLKSELGKHNQLPQYLNSAVGRDIGLNQVTPRNWRQVSCSPDIRFLYEEQLRTYFADHLLRELKDAGTPLLEECECYQDGERHGQADYFLKLNGTWVPVEAKISALAEKHLLGQVRKYLGINVIRPRRGMHAGSRFSIVETELCLVVDQLGLYIVRATGFVDCAPGRPRWKRTCLPSPDVVRRACIVGQSRSRKDVLV